MVNAGMRGIPADKVQSHQHSIRKSSSMKVSTIIPALIVFTIAAVAFVVVFALFEAQVI